MTNVVPIFKCHCGQPGKPIDICSNDGFIEIVACELCLLKTEAQLSQVRPIFEMMISCNVPRDVASETMTFMLEKIDM